MLTDEEWLSLKPGMPIWYANKLLTVGDQGDADDTRKGYAHNEDYSTIDLDSVPYDQEQWEEFAVRRHNSKLRMPTPVELLKWRLS